MMNKKVLVAILTVLFVLTGALTACQHNTFTKVESITLDKQAMQMYVGDEATLTATALPETATEALTWETDNESVATVDENGKVTAVSAGAAKITLKNVTGTITATCDVTVYAKAESLTLSAESFEVTAGEVYTLTATVTPAEGTEKVAYTSNNESVATVDQNGKVTAVSGGNATITATVGDKTATCNVKVYAKAENVAFAAETLELTIGEDYTLTATVTPAEGTKKVTYASNNETVATIDENGEIAALAVGTATITATLDGKTATLTLTVYAKAESVTLSQTSVLMNPSETLTLTATVTPAEGTKAPVFTSSNEAVATVDQDGKVTALKAGMTTITVTVGDKTATCEIAILTIELTQNSVIVPFGETTTLQWTAKPVAYEGVLTAEFTSSDESIATVSDDGEITPVKAGAVTITMTVNDKYTVTCQAIVGVPFKTANGIKYTVDDDGELKMAANVAMEAIDVFSNVTASKTYYAEVTFTDMEIVNDRFKSFGLAHVYGDNFMFDKYSTYLGSTGTPADAGYWHRQGLGFNCGDDALSLSHANDWMGTEIHKILVDAYTKNGSVTLASARNGKYIYTFINGVIVQQVRIASVLENVDTLPAVYTQQLSFGITDVNCKVGAEALAKINGAAKLVRYSRSENGYKPAESKDNYKTIDFTTPEDKDSWHCAVTSEYIFDGNTTIEFDIEFKEALNNNGHICWNVIQNLPAIGFDSYGNGIDNRNNYSDGLTLFGYQMWSTTGVQGLDIFNDTQSFVAKIWQGLSDMPGKFHVKMEFVKGEDNKITSTITLTKEDGTVIYTRSDVSTKTHADEDFRLIFMTNRTKYTVTNLTFAPAV